MSIMTISLTMNNVTKSIITLFWYILCNWRGGYEIKTVDTPECVCQWRRRTTTINYSTRIMNIRIHLLSSRSDSAEDRLTLQ